MKIIIIKDKGCQKKQLIAFLTLHLIILFHIINSMNLKRGK